VSASRRLRISHPADVHEVAADRMADQAMKAEPAVVEAPATGTAPEISRRAEGRTAPPAYGTLPFNAGPGQPLDEGVGRTMGARFGADFSGVRVHTGPRAASAASAMNARAFTAGRSIVFGAGQYQPGSAAGQHLVAHELAHVLQPHPDGRILRAALPFDSTIEIHHNVLQSRSFELKDGEGVVVRVAADWYLDDEATPFAERTPVDLDKSEERPKGLGDEFEISLISEGWIMNTTKGSADVWVSRPARRVLKTSNNGTHHIIVDVADHNHNFYLYGTFQLDKATPEELLEAPDAIKDPTPSEIVHDVLALAGMIPVLGIVPDAADATIYAAEGDWMQAGISAAAMIPIFGDGATLVRLGEKTAVKVSKAAAKRLERRAAAAAIKETRTALKALATPAHFAHFRNAGAAIDKALVPMAREARITQAGITRAAFAEFNVASAKVRVGDTVHYLTAGNSPGRMMHSEDWILSQVQDLKTRNPGVKVWMEQLYSERIPCEKCMEKLARTNAELFYTVREYGTRAADLMKAYGL
jgi:hypothetical protein